MKTSSRENEIIEKLFSILTELDARESTNNCVVSELISRDWIELCDDAIELLEQLKSKKV